MYFVNSFTFFPSKNRPFLYGVTIVSTCLFILLQFVQFSIGKHPVTLWDACWPVHGASLKKQHVKKTHGWNGCECVPDEGEPVSLGRMVIQPLGVPGDGPLRSLWVMKKSVIWSLRFSFSSSTHWTRQRCLKVKPRQDFKNLTYDTSFTYGCEYCECSEFAWVYKLCGVCLYLMGRLELGGSSGEEEVQQSAVGDQVAHSRTADYQLAGLKQQRPATKNYISINLTNQ